MCSATVNELVHTRTTHGGNVGGKSGPGPHLCQIPSEPRTPFTPTQCLERQKLLLGKCFLGICQFHDVQSALLILPRTQRTAESKVAARGCPWDTNDDYSGIHSVARSDCGFLCVCFGHVTHLAKFRKAERLRHLSSRCHPFSRHESRCCNLPLMALSSFINQLEAGLLVHAFQLPLHFRRHEVSSSPMRTMFSSSSSNLALSTRRTSHPSRDSAEAWPPSSCSREYTCDDNLSGSRSVQVHRSKHL